MCLLVMPTVEYDDFTGRNRNRKGRGMRDKIQKTVIPDVAVIFDSYGLQGFTFPLTFTFYLFLLTFAGIIPMFRLIDPGDIPPKGDED